MIAILSALLTIASAADPGIPTLVFMSDFGVKDSAVAVCKGVMWQVAPNLRIVDLTHEAMPYDIEAAGRILEQTTPFYPENTVFVAVIDPGVGSRRRSIAVKTSKGHFLVGPDNGLFGAVVGAEGLDLAVELKEAKYFRSKVSFTFHGRDVFSSVGAHLASGAPIEAMGPRIDRIATLEAKAATLKDGILRGEVSYIEDPYGNIVTNIPKELIEKAGLAAGDALSVSFGDAAIKLPFKNTFSDVPEGKPLALYHSRGMLSFSINRGDFAQAYRIKAYQSVSIVKTK